MSEWEDKSKEEKIEILKLEIERLEPLEGYNRDRALKRVKEDLETIQKNF